MIVCGIDIGNSTTEVALARVNSRGLSFIGTGIKPTTGIKGTVQNIGGILGALDQAAKQSGINVTDISVLRINEAAPVISDVAMETITETIVTESTMIGHNPSTPGGLGLGLGITVLIGDLPEVTPGRKVIALVPGQFSFSRASEMINSAMARGIGVEGAVVQNDDGVLIANRLTAKIPVVDEVKFLEKVPQNILAAIEVAPQGQTIRELSNPFGIARIFSLSAEETKLVVPIARALIGNRSAVVVKTPRGDVRARRIPAGRVTLSGEKFNKQVDLQEGASAIMTALESLGYLKDVSGEAGTNVGGMIEHIKHVMAGVTEQTAENINIKDLLAVDTVLPQKVVGGVAGEFSLENAVALAALVRTAKLPMERVASGVKNQTGVTAVIGGSEAVMALFGALTTPGTARPLAVLDLGAGSTNAAMISEDGEIKYEHVAGAGAMVTMLIKSELGLQELQLAEDIKRHPLAHVESPFHIRHEDGTVQFFQKPLDARLFARVVIFKGEGMFPLDTGLSMEKIRLVRRQAKQRVFVTNAIRALKKVVPAGNLARVGFVVLIGGSSLDFEIPEMICKSLGKYGIVAGRGNIRGQMGPRNAVATGLVLTCAGEGLQHE